MYPFPSFLKLSTCKTHQFSLRLFDPIESWANLSKLLQILQFINKRNNKKGKRNLYKRRVRFHESCHEGQYSIHVLSPPLPLIPDNSNRGKKSGSPSSAGSRAILNGTRHAARAYIYTCTCTSHLNMRTRKWPYAARRPGLRLLMNCIIRDIHSAGFTLTRLLLHFIKSPLRGATGTDDEPRVRRSPKYQVPFNPD